jgi:hypothetical protein
MKLMALRHATLAGVMGAALLYSYGARAASANDTVYRWVDDQGGVHFTQREDIPAPYRGKAVPLGSAAGQPPPGATQSQPERATGPTPPPPPPPPPATPRQPPPPTAPERVALDELLEKAQTTDQYLVIGEAYLRLGLPLAAKTCATKAAAVAKTSPEWARVADAYAAIGDAPASSEARKKSEQVQQQERALQNPPR